MSAAPQLRAAILIVSTTAANDPSADASEATLRQVFEAEGGKWDVAEAAIVPDATTRIQRQLKRWSKGAGKVNLIVTTGGTGFAQGDDTPEAVSEILDRPAPGLVHAMLSASLAVTPFAMMSRPVAGVLNETVIITLPGSQGARENLEAVIKTLPHACLKRPAQTLELSTLAESSDWRPKPGYHHKAGAAVQPHHHHPHSHSHGHGHGHGHGGLVRHTKPGSEHLSNDPSLGPSRRQRASPYPMLDVPDALALIEEHTPRPKTVTSAVNTQLVGSILAQDVVARENVPAFRASIVDGYAVVVPSDGNMKGTYPVTAISHAAPGEAKPLKLGEIARITTGAPLPEGATSVIMVEDTVLKSMTDDGSEEREVELLADGVKEDENIREVGSDIKQGTKIMSKGEKISGVGGELGLLAAVGVAEVETYSRPVVGVLSTGDEIVEHDKPGNLRLGEVRDTNRITLLSAVRQWGFEAVDLGIARDKPGTLEQVLRDGFRRVDVIITTGGVSMGELDLLKPTIERALGGTVHFGRRTVKPIFSLPGNPASALVTFHLFVLPSLHHLSGQSPAGVPSVPVTLSHDFPLDKGRPEYHRACVSVGRDGLLSASSTGGQRSSKVGSMKTANALLCMPKGEGPLRTGHVVQALLIAPIQPL
ncbi:unnamed protein product [Parascedosporium putredinis]|uniref:MoaB/Mog domain-containing protein n=1 Tax=Parascedosporium putredinis TaxID=1442378 RepID=A0A9P1GV93_9PEZI|nr:unnamed protein product [Parascedosporium putredinis]CAI7987710.1 unnamed protein product [Parascedosporium putredinis]